MTEEKAVILATQFVSRSNYQITGRVRAALSLAKDQQTRMARLDGEKSKNEKDFCDTWHVHFENVSKSGEEEHSATVLVNDKTGEVSFMMRI